MRTETDLEELLGNTVRPNLAEGPHRAALKARLLTESRKDLSSMKIRKSIVVISIIIGAAAVAWATQQAWRLFVVQGPAIHGPVVVQPDGKVGAGASMIAGASNDPKFTQAQADEQWASMKKAIADGRYKLRETRETNGMTVYLYDITLPGGKVVGFGSQRPMEDIKTELLNGAQDK